MNFFKKQKRAVNKGKNSTGPHDEVPKQKNSSDTDKTKLVTVTTKAKPDMDAKVLKQRSNINGLRSQTRHVNGRSATSAATSRSSKKLSNSKKLRRKVREVNYDINPTLLYKFIEYRDWNEAIERLEVVPKEARTWVFRYEDYQDYDDQIDHSNAEVRWRMLPIHIAIIFNAPMKLVSALVQAYPEGLCAPDDRKMLPIHLCCRSMNNMNVAQYLIIKNTKTLSKKDYKGRTPLELLQEYRDQNLDPNESKSKQDLRNRDILIKLIFSKCRQTSHESLDDESFHSDYTEESEDDDDDEYTVSDTETVDDGETVYTKDSAYTNDATTVTGDGDDATTVAGDDATTVAGDGDDRTEYSEDHTEHSESTTYTTNTKDTVQTKQTAQFKDADSVQVDENGETVMNQKASSVKNPNGGSSSLGKSSSILKNKNAKPMNEQGLGQTEAVLQKGSSEDKSTKSRKGIFSIIRSKGSNKSNKSNRSNMNPKESTDRKGGSSEDDEKIDVPPDPIPSEENIQATTEEEKKDEENPLGIVPQYQRKMSYIKRDGPKPNEGLREVNYDTNNRTILIKLIEGKMWKQAVARCIEYPDEAATWMSRLQEVKSNDEQKEVQWKILPIHSAIVLHAPLELIEALVEAYPQGLRKGDDRNMLPLHMAFRLGVSPQTTAVLVDAYPEALKKRDSKGHTPLHILKAYRRKYQKERANGRKKEDTIMDKNRKSLIKFYLGSRTYGDDDDATLAAYDSGSEDDSGSEHSADDSTIFSAFNDDDGDYDTLFYKGMFADFGRLTAKGIFAFPSLFQDTVSCKPSQSHYADDSNKASNNK